MDPIGFSLEHFDAIGRWRDTDGAAPVDASATLPDGTKFSGAAELRALLSSRRDDFVTTVIDDRCRSRRASSVVVVPALIAIVIPSSTVSAATAAIAAFSARC